MVASPHSSPKPTVRDVARRAGVSTATVSRALSRPERVSAATRERVETAAREVGYIPNAMARSLRRRQADAVLVLLPDIGNSFFSEIIKGIEEIAFRQRCAVLIGETGEDPASAGLHLEALLAGRVDGILLLDGRVPDFAVDLDPAPIVQVSDYDPRSRFPQVRIDHEAAAVIATEHLLALGHRRIAHVAGPLDTAIVHDRIRGWRKALSAAGLDGARAAMAPGAFGIKGGSAAAEILLTASPRPTALFCSSDEMAIGAAKAARQRGLQIPRDLSIVGFDDLLLAAAVDPPLTTLRQPRRELGRRAMAILNRLLDGEPVERRVELLDAELIVRGTSTAPATVL
ncbi:MAG: LacI family DNA-binding transcriptional regulator [Azospirillaceae bacterium]